MWVASEELEMVMTSLSARGGASTFFVFGAGLLVTAGLASGIVLSCDGSGFKEAVCDDCRAKNEGNEPRRGESTDLCGVFAAFLVDLVMVVGERSSLSSLRLTQGVQDLRARVESGPQCNDHGH